MAPFRHRQLFFARSENRDNSDHGDAEEIVDALPIGGRDSDFYDQRYAQSPTAEPLSESMVRLVRSQLATLFYERMAFGIISTMKFRVEWNATGDEEHLSSPISFQSLYDSGKALPVNRPDYDDDGISVVRVKIDTALEFLLDLIHRERETMPSIGLAAEMENRQHLEACEKWVDGVMEHAGRVGIDRNGFTWEAVRRAKAALNGEAFDEYQTDPLWNHLGTTLLPVAWVDPPDELERA
ncbi:hypothetical protein UCREL1_1549 [Eutypa lata UCREL1]|uniref:Uncharacterized protein n=1 Tax=Eutypa lata (strain UCR-EL1) TaxID=1287681 RepID=M7SXS2_EUTLA|nr:hypothetical protein UCREL1_1549 [Eutypa lata UCREL1]